MSQLSLPSTSRAWVYSTVSTTLEKSMKLVNENAPLPPNASKLGPGQALVQVLSSAINPIDYKLPELAIIGRLAVSKPATPGQDYAGRVIAVGPDPGKQGGYAGVKAGQLVFGMLLPPIRYGTLGSYIVAETNGFAAIPDGVDVDDAASVGTAGLTAYQSLVPYVKRGDSVFINGGSGGTGVFGIQFAKAIGCHVTTTCSTTNVELCKSLGADEVIDYRSSNVAAELKRSGRKFDHVVDNVGNVPSLYWEAKHCTKPSAKYIQVGCEISVSAFLEIAKSMMWPNFFGGGQRTFKFLSLKPATKDYAQIGAWMKDGKVKAVIEQKFALENAPKAFEKLKSHRTKGKLVIKVNEEQQSQSTPSRLDTSDIYSH